MSAHGHVGASTSLTTRAERWSGPKAPHQRAQLDLDDPLPPAGVLSLQLAFRVAPNEVATCAATLKERGVAIISEPTDQPFGHRTVFFRDPDGNVLEIYAEI
jgi:catechol 2,3-dioxygenase-like lactoylglutathione lyase family enzyme